jgi:3-hydroxyisobutyrate dehydrogenase
MLATGQGHTTVVGGRPRSWSPKLFESTNRRIDGRASLPSLATIGAVSAFEPGSTRIGWIGTGVMGASMCGHLLDAGASVTVYSRTRGRAQGLLERGARWADSPAEVAAASEVVFTMVGFPSDVRETVLGERGVLAAARPGGVLVDMTTSEPALAQEIALAARERELDSIDAPVSGGDVGAREARLSIMVGGEPAAVERVRPLLERMGQTIVHQGPAGAGQHTKMVNQTLIATGMIGVCEALLYAHRAGLEPERVLESVSGGAAGSWSLTNYAPRMLRGDFEPGFLVEHFIKDMEIALAEARRMNLALPGLARAHELYLALRAQGGGRDGTQALIRALASLSAVDLSG